MSKLLSWVNERFWERVVTSTHQSVQSAAVFRLLVGLFLLLFYSPNFQWIGQIPSAFYNPPLFSVAFLFKSFPPVIVFIALDVFLLICILCITIGIQARLLTRLYILFSVIGYSFQYSIGKIDHNILLLALLGCMSFSGWGTQLALVPDKIKKSDSIQKSFALLAVLLCFGFFSAGFEKALNWINADITRSGTAYWFQSGFYAMGRTHLLAPLGEKIPVMVFKMMDCFAVAFELLPFVCLLFSRRAWITWLGIACIFHMINLLLLNIPFFLQAIIYLAFLDYSALYKKVHAKPRTISIVCFFALLVFFIRLFQAMTHQSSGILFISDDAVELSLWIYLVGWVLVASGFILRGFAKPLSPIYLPRK